MDKPLHLKFAEDDVVVLLLEDDMDDTFLFEKLCSSTFSNVKVITCKTVHKANSILKDLKPDVIFADLNVGDSVGPSSVLDLKKVRPEVPLYVATGMPSDITREECLKAGAYDFFDKSKLNQSLLSEQLEMLGLDIEKL